MLIRREPVSITETTSREIPTAMATGGNDGVFDDDDVSGKNKKIFCIQMK